MEYQRGVRLKGGLYNWEGVKVFQGDEPLPALCQVRYKREY